VHTPLGTPAGGDRRATMKVGYLNYGLPQHGVVRYGSYLAAEMARQGEEVTDVHVASNASPREYDDALRSLAHCDVVHLQLRRAFRTWALGSDARHGTRLIERAFALLPRVVLTMHDFNNAEFGPIDDGLNTIARQLQAAVGVIVFDEHERRAVQQYSGVPTRETFPFVEDRCLRLAKDAAKAQLGLSGAVVTVLGFVFPRKGHAVALDCLNRCAIAVTLVFAGGSPAGGSDQFLNKLATKARKRGVAQRLVVTGYLSEPDLEAYLAATDLALCPFLASPASASLSTWISVGKPVIASAVPQLLKYAALQPDGLWYVEPGNADELAQAIDRHIVNVPDTRREVLALRDQLHIRRMAREHLDFYSHALQVHASR